MNLLCLNEWGNDKHDLQFNVLLRGLQTQKWHLNWYWGKSKIQYIDSIIVKCRPISSGAISLFLKLTIILQEVTSGMKAS